GALSRRSAQKRFPTDPSVPSRGPSHARRVSRKFGSRPKGSSSSACVGNKPQEGVKRATSRRDDATACTRLGRPLRRGEACAADEEHRASLLMTILPTLSRA